MKASKEKVTAVRKRDRLYPTKQELDRYRELKKQYGIRDELVVNGREVSDRKKPDKQG